MPFYILSGMKVSLHNLKAHHTGRRQSCRRNEFLQVDVPLAQWLVKNDAAGQRRARTKRRSGCGARGAWKIMCISAPRK
jgi:hypothetical protein